MYLLLTAPPHQMIATSYSDSITVVNVGDEAIKVHLRTLHDISATYVYCYA